MISEKNNLVLHFIFVMVILAFALICSINLFSSTKCLCGGDSGFHLARILDVASSLRNGVFPARMNGNAFNGYGNAVLIMYPSTFIYLPAIIYNITFNYNIAFNSFLIIINIISGLIMYYAMYSITKNMEQGFIASLLWMFSQYRLVDLYSRVAVGELLGAAFLPLFILGLYKILIDEKSKCFCFIIASTLIVRSHILTIVFAIIFSIIFFLINIHKFSLLKVKKILISIVAIILINLNVLLPIFDMIKGYDMQYPYDFGLVKSALNLDTFFYKGLNFSIGALATILLISSIIFCIFSKLYKQEMVRTLIILSSFFTIITTKLFPWEMIYSNNIIKPLCDRIQFTWRFSMISSICIAMLASYLIYDIINRILKLNYKYCGYIIFIVIIFMFYPSYLKQQNYTDSLVRFGSRDYMPANNKIMGSDLIKTFSGKLIYDESKVEVTNVKHGYNQYSFDYKLKNNVEQTKVTIPLFKFPYYECKDGEKYVDISDEDGIMVIDLKNANGIINIKYIGNKLWKYYDIISLISFIVFLLCPLFELYIAKIKAPL